MEGVGFPIPNTLERKPDGIYGSIQTIKSHPATEPLLEWAEKAPSRFGLSHNADGKETKRAGGKSLIESLTCVRSIDVVRNPATTNGLFESRNQTVPTTIKAIIESQFPQTCKGSLLIEDAGLAAMPVEVPAEASSEDQIWGAFKQAIMASVDDDGLDIKATLKKIGEILKAYEKLTGSESSKPAKPESSEEKPAMESKDVAALQAQITLMESREHCRELLESAGVKSSPVRLKSLAPLSDDERKELIAEWKGTDSQPARPRTASPLFESKNDASGTIPTDGKKFADLCR
jgi:hypothetical protein